jgi:hypothetical protein
MSKIIVPLERRFSRVAKDQDSAEHNDYLEHWGYGKPIGWPEIDARHCTVILAPGGAGKTHEMELRAKYLHRQGRPSFFIRIEDIDASFETAFEVGVLVTVQQKVLLSKSLILSGNLIFLLQERRICLRLRFSTFLASAYYLETDLRHRQFSVKSYDLSIKNGTIACFFERVKGLPSIRRPALLAFVNRRDEPPSC